LPRRLVGEQDLGAPQQRAGDRDPLLLATGHLGRQVAGPPTEADEREQLIRARGVIARALARHERRQQHVLGGGQRREEVEELEDEAEDLAAQPGQRPVVEVVIAAAVDLHAAAGRPVERAEDVEQGALAGPGRAHDGDELAVGHRESTPRNAAPPPAPGRTPS
jgi:hypothetical protein